MSEKGKRRRFDLRPRAVVVGAGIAGLTAAMELVERGFEVEVVEASSFSDPLTGDRVPHLGGMARTQWGVKVEGEAQWSRLTFHDVIEQGDRFAELAERFLPGEHGFRFFPGFYRHLFDTMKRIPLTRVALIEGPDERGNSPQKRAVEEDSHRTVFDNLIPVDTFRFGLVGETEGAPANANSRVGTNTPGRAENAVGRSFVVSRRGVRSIEELRQYTRLLLDNAGYSPRDIALFVRRIVQYATTSTQRRLALENESWADFARLDDFESNLKDHVEKAPQALVAMSARDSDARTIASVGLQLLLDQLRDGEYVDGVLNGPTTTAWFRPWYRYLHERGVRFTVGTMNGFVSFPEGSDLVVGHRPTFDVEVAPADYYVVTIPVDRLQPILREAFPVTDDAADPLQGSRDLARARDFPIPTPEELRAHPDQGSLRYMIGVQFYFDNEVDLIRGHTMCSDSPWGVSCISQGQYWTQKLRRTQFKAVLSCCVSQFEEPYDGKMAKDCTAAELAVRTWNQIKDTLPDDVPDPVYFYIDEGVSFDGPGDTMSANATPYLINKTGQWDLRPGVDDPDEGGARRYQYPLQLVPQHPGTGAELSGGLALAGVLMGTTTRLTTMEAANESGRRAVNAVLRHEGGWRQTRPTYDGRYMLCETWDMECFEALEMRPLKKLERKFAEAGEPHPLDTKAADIAMKVLPFGLLSLFKTREDRALE